MNLAGRLALRWLPDKNIKQLTSSENMPEIREKVILNFLPNLELTPSDTGEVFS